MEARQNFLGARLAQELATLDMELDSKNKCKLYRKDKNTNIDGKYFIYHAIHTVFYDAVNWNFEIMRRRQRL